MTTERRAAGGEAALERAGLGRLLARRSVRRGDFVLASGARSEIYVDCRTTTMHALAMPLVGRVVLRALERRGWEPEAVGGLTMGADPIAYAVARESVEPRWGGAAIDAFSIRKEPKGHGRGRRVEGLLEPAGRSVVVLEDVCTSGGSLARAIEAAWEAGMKVLGALCLVDRELGGAERIDGLGVAFERIFTIGELLGAQPDKSGANIEGA